MFPICVSKALPSTSFVREHEREGGRPRRTTPQRLLPLLQSSERRVRAPPPVHLSVRPSDRTRVMEFRARPSVVRLLLAGPTDGLPPKGSCHHRSDGRWWPRQTNPPRAQFHATSDANDWHVHSPAARPEPGTADALFLFSFLIPGSFIRGIDWTRPLASSSAPRLLTRSVPLSLPSPSPPRSLVVSSPSDGACVHAGEQKKVFVLDLSLRKFTRARPRRLCRGKATGALGFVELCRIINP